MAEAEARLVLMRWTGVQCIQQRACPYEHPRQERYYSGRCDPLSSVVRVPRESDPRTISLRTHLILFIVQYAQPVTKKGKQAPPPAEGEEKAKLSNHAQRKLDAHKKGAYLCPLHTLHIIDEIHRGQD